MESQSGTGQSNYNQKSEEIGEDETTEPNNQGKCNNPDSPHYNNDCPYTRILVDGEHQISPEQAKEVRRDCERGIIIEKKMKQRQKGSFSGRWLEEVYEMMNTEINWTEILNRILKQLINVPGAAWIPPNRRLQAPGGIYLPGTISRQEQAQGLLIITVDTSGSIGSDDLKKFFKIIYDTRHYFKHILVIQHDCDIQHEEELVDVDNRKWEVYGRGGTSHDPVFKRITQLLEEEHISAIFMLTDLYSDISVVGKNYSWLMNKEIPLFVFDSDWSKNKADRVFLEELGYSVYNI